MVDLGSTTDPWIGFHFTVEIAGVQQAKFTDCSGLEAKVDVFEYQEGGVNDFVHKLPGRRSFSNVTLKRGVTSSTHLWEWLHRLATKAAKSSEKKNISIVLYDKKGTEVFRWNLINAYPVKWTGPTMQTEQSAVLIESLELAFQEFTIAQG